MIKNTPRQEFLASIAKLGKEFEKAKHEVEAHELALDEAMQQLSKIIKDKHINAVSRFAQDNPLKEEVNRADELMTLRFEKWEEQIKNRTILRQVMIQAGFISLPSEWWHFNALLTKDVRANFSKVSF